MTPPIRALRAALLARCAGDATLAGLMGGAATIHDEPPRDAVPVYAVFGDSEARDASTSTEGGHEQDLAVHLWGRPGSAASALAAGERMAELLGDAPLAPAGHRLIRLSVVSLAVEREERSRLARVVLRLRAVTEAL